MLNISSRLKRKETFKKVLTSLLKSKLFFILLFIDMLIFGFLKISIILQFLLIYK